MTPLFLDPKYLCNQFSQSSHLETGGHHVIQINADISKSNVLLIGDNFVFLNERSHPNPIIYSTKSRIFCTLLLGATNTGDINELGKLTFSQYKNELDRSKEHALIGRINLGQRLFDKIYQCSLSATPISFLMLELDSLDPSLSTDKDGPIVHWNVDRKDKYPELKISGISIHF
jgi:hypothetical protein